MKKSERAEAIEVSRRIIGPLTTFPVSSFSTAAATMRLAIGQYMSNFTELRLDTTVGPELLTCFETARNAGATLGTMDRVRVAMFEEAPQFPLCISIVNAAIIFSFVEQCQIIAVMEFRSRTDVNLVIDKMVPIIDEIKLNRTESFLVSDYQNFVALSALLIQHLSATERQLPRILQLTFPANFPSLALANRIYADASRSDELIAENRTVHPAFMARDILALSS
jgi:hypothetical protein